MGVAASLQPGLDPRSKSTSVPSHRRRQSSEGEPDVAIDRSFTDFLTGDGGNTETRCPRRRRTWRDEDTVMPDHILVWGGMELSGDIEERERRAGAHRRRKSERTKARKLLEKLASNSFDRRPPLPPVATPAFTDCGGRYMDPSQWRLEHNRLRAKAAQQDEANGGWHRNHHVLRDGMTMLRVKDSIAGEQQNARRRDKQNRRNYSELPRCGDWVEPPSRVVDCVSANDSANTSVVLGGTSHVRVLTPLNTRKPRRRRTTAR